MGRECWEFHHEDNKHIIRLKHNPFTGISTVFVDDKKVSKKISLLGTEVKHSFEIQGEECQLSITLKGLEYDYSLQVKNEVLDKMLKEEKQPIEWWAWFFIIACCIIPIITIESITTLVIGLWGALTCVSIAQKSKKARKGKVLACVRTMVIACAGVGIFYFVINDITAYLMKIYL